MRQAIRDDILGRQLRDNQQSSILQEDGTYLRRRPGGGEALLDSQAERIHAPGSWHSQE